MNLPDKGTSTRLLLIRHTEPVDDMRGRCYGSSDVGLSPAGLAHANTLSERLSLLPISTIVSSPRRRTVDTARPIAASHAIPLQRDAALQELDFGDVEGATYEEIEHTRPELWREWMTCPTEVQFPGGESYRELRARAVGAINRIRRDNVGGVIAIVTHGGVTRAALAATLGMPDSCIFRLDQRYGAINIVDWFSDTPVVRVVNG